jgi:hypothetical protein
MLGHGIAILHIPPNSKVFTIGVRIEFVSMSKAHESRIPCSRETRKLVAAQKRGGENYDSVLRKMAKQYDPERTAEAP